MAKRPLRGVLVGEIRGGRFVPDDPQRWRQVIQARDGLRTRVEIGPIPKLHSDSQRNYYWAGVVGAMHEWSGQDKDQCHDYLKDEVLRPMLGRKLLLPLPDGGHIQDKATTTVLTSDEMNEYIAACKAFLWNKHEVMVPDIDSVSMR